VLQEQNGCNCLQRSLIWNDGVGFCGEMVTSEEEKWLKREFQDARVS